MAETHESQIECDCDPEYVHHCAKCGGTGRRIIRVKSDELLEDGQYEAAREIEEYVNSFRGLFADLRQRKPLHCEVLEVSGIAAIIRKHAKGESRG